MTWSITKSGSKSDLVEYLTQDVNSLLSGVTGDELVLAHQAIGLARAIVQKGVTGNVLYSVSATGHSSNGGGGAQSLEVSVRYTLLS